MLTAIPIATPTPSIGAYPKITLATPNAIRKTPTGADIWFKASANICMTSIHLSRFPCCQFANAPSVMIAPSGISNEPIATATNPIAMASPVATLTAP